MSPPMVYEETKPRSHRTTKMITMVSSILPLFLPELGDDPHPILHLYLQI